MQADVKQQSGGDCRELANDQKDGENLQVFVTDPKKLSQIQTFFCHRFKHFFQHRSNHALDIHFLLLLLYDWPNIANKKSGECGDFWPSRSFLVFCFLNEQWSEKLEIICRLYFLPSDQFVSFHFHFLNRKVFHVLVKEYLVSSQASLLPFATLNQNDKKRFCSRKTSCMKAGVAPNLHFPHLHQTQIYTIPRYTWDPYLHSTDLHKSIFWHRSQETQIYTTQIYTKPKFTQNFFFKFCIKLYQVNSIINPG